MNSPKSDPPTPESILGKSICASVTYLDTEGNVRERILTYGSVIHADREVITYRLHGREGETFTIPAAYEHLQPPEEGVVYLMDDKQGQPLTVDYVTTFTVTSEEEA